MRENLIALLNDLRVKGFWSYGIDRNTGKEEGHDMTPEGIADYLLENGVTIPMLCKDCKHWVKADNGSWHMKGRTDGICTKLVNHHGSRNYMTERDHFCSYGERRTHE